MNLSTMKKITKRYWDIIPIPNTIIYRVNLLGIYQQDILVFIDCRGQIIGDGYFELTWVDGYGDENEAPLKVENKDDLGYKEDQEEVHPEQEDQTIIKPIVKV